MLQFSLTKSIRRSYQPKRQIVIKYITRALLKKYSIISINVIIVSSDDSRRLNKQYRDKDKPTNVISLAYDNDGLNILTGDLILCDDIIVNEAMKQNKSYEAHYAHMIVHGILHLQGLDHINATEATHMESLEINILKSLGFNNPYYVL